MNGGSSGQPPRSALTLLELMIVLVVMVGLLAIAWPRLSRPLADDSLRQAAGILGDEIGEARVMAASQGQPIVMRFREGSGRVARGPLVERLTESPRDSSVLEIALPSSVVVKSFTTSRDAAAIPRNTLDEFHSGERRRRDPDGRLEPDLKASGRTASFPLLLLPDGRSRNCTIELRDVDNGREIAVRYDGTTGLVEIAPIRRESQP